MSPGPSWSFLLDENVGKALARALRAAGYHAVRVLDVGLGSQLDSAVFRYARVHQHIVVTNDKDWLNPIQFPPPHAGIIFLRMPKSMTTIDIIGEVLNALNTLDGQDLSNKVVIIEPGRVHVSR
jgi:predicted nuclease of predicted toxin-antitoxin system